MIKFRVYDNQEKKYVKYLNEFFIDSNGSFLHEEKYIKYVPYPHIYTVEMCSGQKETMYGPSNSEIWEGDVLSVFFNNENQRVGYVKYDEDMGAFVIHKENGGLEILSQYLINSRVEITGTIHEE